MQQRTFIKYFLLLSTGCSATTVFTSTSVGKTLDILHFVINGAKGMEELQHDCEPSRLALSKVLQTQIEFFSTENILTAAAAMISGQIDLAWVGAKSEKSIALLDKKK